PSLKPGGGQAKSVAMTGTDPTRVSSPTATQPATLADVDGCKPVIHKACASISHRSTEPKVTGSNPVGCNRPKLIVYCNLGDPPGPHIGRMKAPGKSVIYR